MMDIFYNPQLVMNIQCGEHQMNIHCTAGVTTTDLVANLPGYGTIWFHPNGIANILLLSQIKERHRVTYDSTNGNAFLVHQNDGTTCRFAESKNCLYFSDVLASKDATLLVSTVASNRSSYTNDEYSRATLAQQVQCTIGQPSTKDFI